MNGSAADTSFGRTQWLVVLCFALSGLSALMYQMAWTRLFSITFGTSDVAIAAVLAGYMGGLALGSVAAGRVAHRINRPLRVYALLEGGVAATALLVPVLLRLASWLYVHVNGYQPEPIGSSTLGQTTFYLVATFVIVGLPTAMMGATLPVIVRHLVHTKQQIGSRVGLIYGVNTAGAVAGVLLSAFYMLPMFGISGVVWMAVCVNVFIFLIAMTLPRFADDGHEGDGAQQEVRARVFAAPGLEAVDCTRSSMNTNREKADLVLPIMLLSGWASFIYEILWTRLLGHVLGNSMYAFAIMLATFLTGIALGGVLGGWSIRHLRQPAVAFSAVQVGIALSSVLTWFLLEYMIADASSLFGSAAVAAAVMLPPALFIGATYPIAVSVISKSPQDAGKQAARVYAWNTLGAIVGAVSAGFILLPAFGFEGTIRIAVASNLALALTTVVFVVRPALRAVVPSVVLLLVVAVIFVPERPRAATSSSSLDIEWQQPRELFYAVGRASTVLLRETELGFELRTNGLPEALIPFRGSLAFRNSQRWLGLLPVLARPDTRSMMIVGLGGGVVIEGIPPTVDDIDVVELEQEVLAANRLIQDRRTVDPLSQPRVRLVINDARNALGLTNKRYDAIVSQPSHPWTSGAAHLFSDEFVRLAKRHLTDDGTLVMWMDASFLTAELLRSLAATIQANFEYVRVYQLEVGDLHFLASDKPLAIEQEIEVTGRPLVNAVSHYADNGILSSVDVAAALLMDEKAVRKFSVGARLITDDRNYMATASRSFGDGLTGHRLVNLLAPHDSLLDPASEIRLALSNTDLIYLVEQLLHSGQRARVDKMFETLPEDGSGQVVLAMLTRCSEDVSSRDAHLYRPYQVDPTDRRAAWLLVQNGLDSLTSGKPCGLTATVREEIGGGAEAMVRAWEAYRSRDWETVREMDRDLARVPATDPWYSHAMELRARWRLQEPTDSNINEAAGLVERALSRSGEYELYDLRARAAWLQNDVPRYLESVIYSTNALLPRIHRASVYNGSPLPETAEELLALLQHYSDSIDNDPLIASSPRSASAKKVIEEIDVALVNLKGAPQ